MRDINDGCLGIKVPVGCLTHLKDLGGRRVFERRPDASSALSPLICSVLGLSVRSKALPCGYCLIDLTVGHTRNPARAQETGLELCMTCASR